MKKKLLITGGSGFLASHLYKFLFKKNFIIKVLDTKQPNYSIKNSNFFKSSVIEKKKLIKITKNIDIVLHFASIADIAKANKDPLNAINVNLIGTINLLEACIKNKVKKIIFASSIYALSEQGGFYSSTKLSSEIFIKRYSKKYNLEYNILRFGSIFGENANKFNTINQIINNYKKRKKILRNTDGSEIRNYIHVKDAAKICHQIMIDKDNINKTFNIIGSKSYKVKKLLNEVGKKLDREVIFSKNKIIRSDHYKINPYSLKITKGKMITPKNAIGIKEWLISNLS